MLTGLTACSRDDENAPADAQPADAQPAPADGRPMQLGQPTTDPGQPALEPDQQTSSAPADPTPGTPISPTTGAPIPGQVEPSAQRRMQPVRRAENNATLSPPDQAFQLLWMVAHESQPIYPMDTGMDALQIQSHPAINTLDKFFAALRQGQLCNDCVDEADRFSVELALEPALRRQITVTDQRLGAFQQKDNALHIPIRLFTNQTSAVGMLYVHRSAESWLVQDISFPWEKLINPDPPTIFTPSGRHWSAVP